MEKKRILRNYFILLIMIIFIPNNVFALTLRIEDTNIYQNDYEYYKVSNGLLSNNNATSEDYNIRLDKDNHKLYLNNYNTMKNIYTDLNELDIILEGTNKIITTEFNAIESSGNITFSGKGSFNIIGDGNGIKSTKKVIINDGTYTIEGKNYNGIEAYQIEINGGLIHTVGGYSGIHARFDPELTENSYFKMNGGNIFTKEGRTYAINSSNSYYQNGIVVTEKNNNTSIQIFGKATLLKNITLSTNLTIPEDVVLTIPEDVVLNLTNKNSLDLEGSIILHGKMMANEKEYHNIYINETENGIVRTLHNIALEGEEVNLTIIPNETYKLKVLKYTNEQTKEEVNIIDNKFIMPNSDIIINSAFTKEETIKNPTTGNNIKKTLLLLGISLIGTITIIIYLKKQNKNIN